MKTSSNLHLDLNLLKVFEVLFVEQNMTRAAEVLFMTPSAVSHAIKRLREALQDPLFERKGHKMLPTPVCRRIAPQLLDHLSGLRTSLQQFTEFSPTSSPYTFRISIHDALESLYVPQLFGQLQSVSPELHLDCVQLDRQQVPRQLASGQVDVAIDVALPIQAPINHMHLNSDKFAVLANQQHFAEAMLDRSAYLQAEHIAVSNRPSGRVIEDIHLLKLGYERRIALRCQNFHTAKALLKDSSMLLTAPFSIATMLADDDLIQLPIPFELPEIDIHLYWHKQTENDSATKWLRKQIFNLLQA
ncbi:MAG: LysR family transcriptional regulator [Aestuariibacter sp.]